MAIRDQLAEEAARDISAARAELSGRRDQVVAEYDERLSALQSLAGALEDGSSEPKAVQQRVRQILGERAATGTMRAGRTTIGMSVPTAKPTQPVAPVQMGPTPSRAGQTVAKVIGDLDAHMVTILTRSGGTEARRTARCELSLLLRVRRGLERQAADLPRDVVLLGSVVEYADLAEATLADLVTGGAARVKRLLEHDRTVLSEVGALGGTTGPLKERLQKARATAEAGKVDAAASEAVAIYGELQQQLDQRSPLADPTLLDDLARL
jgi:hypothetical protein